MNTKLITSNKKARFKYEILDSLEAGIVLYGTEVKSMREGKCSLQEAYIIIEKNNELFVKNMNIPHYTHGNINNHEPVRNRKLLLHKKEIINLAKSVNEKGITLIPLKIYFKGSLAKVEVGICKGKKLYDKRETIKDRDNKRTLDRVIKNYSI